MREHKYRAWDSKNEVMYTEAYITDEGFLCIREGRKSYFDRDEGRAELMQFTGLLDKEGKEIYEGDILSAVELTEMNMLNKEMYPPDEPIIVKWLDSGYSPWFVAPNELVEIEVIGNIYENKELLGE